MLKQFLQGVVVFAVVVAVISAISISIVEFAQSQNIDAERSRQQSRADQSSRIRNLAIPNAEDTGGVTVVVQEADCRFEIVQGVYVAGAAVMLNQCTGDSWRFDSGWDGSKYTRFLLLVQDRTNRGRRRNALRAITLHQPWASLIADGRKHYETRSWEPWKWLAGPERRRFRWPG